MYCCSYGLSVRHTLWDSILPHFLPLSLSCWAFSGRGNEDTGVSSKAAPLKKKYAINTMKCFGVELSPDNIAVAMVYFVQGVLGLSRIAVNFYLKDDLHLDPAEVIIHIVLGCI